MPLYEYVCTDRHVTERRAALGKEKQRVKCTKLVPCRGALPDLCGDHYCGLWAKKRTVYTVSVNGDLPTRSAF